MEGCVFKDAWEDRDQLKTCRPSRVARRNTCRGNSFWQRSGEETQPPRISQDGFASLPDRKFRFEIGIYHVLNKYDYFMDQSRGGMVFAFKCDGKMLEVF